jgi:hypothetical protein
VRNFHFDLNLRASLRSRTHGSFIELTATQRVALALDQRAHLLVERLVALLKTLLNLLDLRSLIVGQVKVAPERPEWSKAPRTAKSAGPARISRPAVSGSLLTFRRPRRWTTLKFPWRRTTRKISRPRPTGLL